MHALFLSLSLRAEGMVPSMLLLAGLSAGAPPSCGLAGRSFVDADGNGYRVDAEELGLVAAATRCECVPCGRKLPRKYPSGSCAPASAQCSASSAANPGCYTGCATPCDCGKWKAH